MTIPRPSSPLPPEPPGEVTQRFLLLEEKVRAMRGDCRVHEEHIESLGTWASETKGGIRVIQWMLGVSMALVLSLVAWLVVTTLTTEGRVTNVEWRLDHAQTSRH